MTIALLYQVLLAAIALVWATWIIMEVKDDAGILKP